jgi:hypothetical protein
MITKPNRNSHKHTSKIANTLILGESFITPISPEGFVESVLETGMGVIVVREVLVGTGKIIVNAGNGTRVVVGVSVGVEEGVYVWEGVLNVAVWD